MAASLGLSQQLTTGPVLDELVQQGHDIVVCTADLGRPTQVIGFGRKYPDRYFNFGIAERNMIGAAAGLATTGHIAVISNYSFFLALMGIENIRNDICYPGLNVRMIGTHSGLAMGFYGTSHHCNEDIGALRAIAGLTLMAPCDGNAIRAAFTNTITHQGPVYLRAGRGREKPVYSAPPDFRIGGSNTLRLLQPFSPRLASANGAWIRDEDGNQILDFWQGHHANILGHNPDIVTSALARCFGEGMGLQTGFTDRLQIEVAEIICQQSGAERVRFTTTGSLAR
jgi:hypothetical protein